MSISTLGIAQRLEAHGFSKFQAEGIAEELVGTVENRDLVTKDFLSAKMAELETKLTDKIGDVRAEIGDVRAEIGDVWAEIGNVRTEIGSLTRWNAGIQFASLGLTLGAMYFLLERFLVK